MRREALSSKEMSPGLNIVLTTVVTVVSYIKMRPPEIKNLVYIDFAKTWVQSLLFYCEARWLRGKFLQRVSELRNEIAIFLEEENLREAEKFRDGLFVMKLSYLWSIFSRN
ncbi:scan domain-containing protein 3-like protein [Trichonephila clavata]|uniref:Scan domain-containing protein 3-like protein n=1 Tax=Trichonephila clavata TaxID=2740835 RepID=A0A8X6FMA0_TRICU|nr:scan domain-containing protein 3-like protein [Trichonephila clavata]